MFRFGDADLTPWVSRVSVQEEYEAVVLERWGAPGLMVGAHQARGWRITAQGYAFGESLSELRQVLGLAKRLGVQRLQFDESRVVPAYLERFAVSEWDGGLLMPNVRLEFVGVGYAEDAMAQALVFSGASGTTNYARNGEVRNRGDYEAALRVELDLTYPASERTDEHLDIFLGVYEIGVPDPREVEREFIFRVPTETRRGVVVIDSGVERYGLWYPDWYRLVDIGERRELPRVPVSRTALGRWQVSLRVKAFNNGLYVFTVHGARVRALQRYSQW